MKVRARPTLQWRFYIELNIMPNNMERLPVNETHSLMTKQTKKKHFLGFAFTLSFLMGSMIIGAIHVAIFYGSYDKLTKSLLSNIMISRVVIGPSISMGFLLWNLPQLRG